MCDHECHLCSRAGEKGRETEGGWERKSKTGMMSVWDEKQWLEECIIIFIFRVKQRCWYNFTLICALKACPMCAVSFFELANKHFHESILVHRTLFIPSYFNSTLSNLTLWLHFYMRPFSFKFFFLQAWHTGQKFFGEVLQTFSNYLPSACLTLSLLIRHCRLTVVQSRRLMRSSAETYVITQAVRKGLARTHML